MVKGHKPFNFDFSVVFYLHYKLIQTSLRSSAIAGCPFLDPFLTQETVYKIAASVMLLPEEMARDRVPQQKKTHPLPTLTSYLTYTSFLLSKTVICLPYFSGIREEVSIKQNKNGNCGLAHLANFLFVEYVFSLQR